VRVGVIRCRHVVVPVTARAVAADAEAGARASQRYANARAR
jgi:hypothetical protein